MDSSDDYSFFFMEEEDLNPIDYHLSSGSNSDPRIFVAEGTYRYGLQVNRYVGIPHESNQMHIESNTHQTPPMQPNPFQTPMQQPPPMLPAVEDADDDEQDAPLMLTSDRQKRA